MLPQLDMSFWEQLCSALATHATGENDSHALAAALRIRSPEIDEIGLSQLEAVLTVC
jgi:hypothetical protein